VTHHALTVTISMGVKELTVQVGRQKGQHKQFVVALEKQLHKVLTEMSDIHTFQNVF